MAAIELALNWPFLWSAVWTYLCWALWAHAKMGLMCQMSWDK